MYLKLCWPNPTHASENTKCFSAFVDKNPPMLMIRQNYFNMYRPNTSNAIEDTKCISTFVDQTPPIPSRTQNLSQHVLTKPILCQQEHKIDLKLRWPNKSHCSEDIKYISIGVWQTPPMPARTKNTSQLLLTKPKTCQRGHKTYLNMCWPNHYHASEEKKCISTPSYASEETKCFSK